MDCNWLMFSSFIVFPWMAFQGLYGVIRMDAEKISAMYADVIDVFNRHDLKYEEDLLCVTLLLGNIIDYGARSMGLDDDKKNEFIDDVLDSVHSQMKGEKSEEESE